MMKFRHKRDGCWPCGVIPLLIMALLALVPNVAWGEELYETVQQSQQPELLAVEVTDASSESDVSDAASESDEPIVADLGNLSEDDADVSAPLGAPEGSDVMGASTYSFPVSYEVDYDASYTLMTRINNARRNSGYDSLLLNSQLQNYALIRAIELSIRYSWSRPDDTADGDGVYISKNVSGSGGDSVCTGRGTAATSDIVNALMTDLANNDYSYQQCIVGNGAMITAIGAAVVKVGDFTFCYICTSGGSLSGPSYKTGRVRGTRTINVSPSYISLSTSPTSLSLQKGSTASVKVLLGKAPISANSGFTWSSANTQVAGLSSGETLTVSGASVGTTTIAGTYKSGASCKISVTVSAPAATLTSDVSSIVVEQGYVQYFHLYRNGQAIGVNDIHADLFHSSSTSDFKLSYAADGMTFVVVGNIVGKYSVRFTDKSTSAKLTIPITVKAAQNPATLTSDVEQIEGPVETYLPFHLYRGTKELVPSDVNASFSSGVSIYYSNSQAVWYARATNPGTYTVTVTDTATLQKLTLPITITAKTTHAVTWTRLWGKGRYDTMGSIVSAGWEPYEPAGDGFFPQVDGFWERYYADAAVVVVIATGRDYKDALAASGLAGLVHGPVILVDGKANSLNSQARRQLERLNPRGAFVVGGPAAVSNGVANEVRSLLYNPSNPLVFQRVYGRNSAATSAAIARAGKYRSNPSGNNAWQNNPCFYSTYCWDGGTAILATNKSFKDALSAAPLSYAKRWPILLVSNGVALDKDVVSALRELGISQVYIAGGKLAVSDVVESQIRNMGITVAGRFAGSDAVHTSRLIADFGLAHGLSADNMGFATSQNYPDALAGAALCGKHGSVLLLCDDKWPGKTDYNLSFAKQHVSEIERGFVFGGTSVFSATLYDRLP